MHLWLINKKEQWGTSRTTCIFWNNCTWIFFSSDWQKHTCSHNHNLCRTDDNDARNTVQTTDFTDKRKTSGLASSHLRLHSPRRQVRHTDAATVSSPHHLLGYPLCWTRQRNSQSTAFQFPGAAATGAPNHPNQESHLSFRRYEQSTKTNSNNHYEEYGLLGFQQYVIRRQV